MIQPEMNKEELDLILSTIKSFAKRRLDIDARLAFDREERCPEELIRELLGPEVGLHLAFIPTAYGGLGGGAMEIFQISELVAGIDLGIATSFLGVSLGTDPIRVGGTDEVWLYTSNGNGPGTWTIAPITFLLTASGLIMKTQGIVVDQNLKTIQLTNASSIKVK